MYMVVETKVHVFVRERYVYVILNLALFAIDTLKIIDVF